MTNTNDKINLSDLTAEGLTLEDRTDIVTSLHNKIQNLSVHSDILDSLSPIVRKRVDALKDIQSQYNELEAKFFDERAALEAKYELLYDPFYTKRYEIVNGLVEVGTDQEVDKSAEDTEKGVPDFWLNAMKSNDVLTDEISERDEGALKYLQNIKSTKINDPKGFKLEFFFDTNTFFKNSVLTKTYHMIEEDDPILEKAIGTEIDWYPGKSLTEKLLKKKPKKGSKNTKPITKTENCESFFNFFKPPEVPGDDVDIDQEEVEDLQNLMEQDYDIGSTIRDKIIPHAVSWFTGEASHEDEFEADNEDDEDEESDEEEDDDDDEEEDETKEKRSTSGPKPVSGAKGERPDECKQQ